jgi:L-arabinonolactonase
MIKRTPPRHMHTLEVANTLGEGVQWRASDSALWWTDIQACRLYRMQWPSQDVTSWRTPERLCSFTFPSDGSNQILAAFESGFAMFEPSTGDTHWLVRPQGLCEGVRLNDGRADPAGRFWAGSMNEIDPEESPDGVLYRLDGNSDAVAVFEGIGISNGLCWSPAGDRMYFADTAKQLVYFADYDLGTGSPGQLQPWLNISDGAPDGAVTDAAGNLWIAIWGGSRVDCFSPAGELLESVALPVPQPTCPAFGGPDNELLFVTSARDGLSTDQLERHPQSGGLFIYHCPP